MTDDVTLVAARIFTPEQTYDRALFRLRAGVAHILNRADASVFRELTGVTAQMVCGDPVECGDPNVYQRWRLVAGDGTHWLAEGVSGCGCGGMIQGEALPAVLEW